MVKKEFNFESLVDLFQQTHTELHNRAARSVDLALVVRNWLFGWYIVEFENGGAERSALYGKSLIKNLALEFRKRKLKGLSATNLWKCRDFYQVYSGLCDLKFSNPLEVLDKIPQTPSVESRGERDREITQAVSVESSGWINSLASCFSLSWSHYVELLSIDSEQERKFYEIEASQNAWSVRELNRQFSSSLYERLALSRDKEKVKELSEKGQLVSKPDDIVKNPYILEFLNLPEHPHFSEHEMETAIINRLEIFLLELGKGFLFEARQKRFSFDNDHFYVDLVFYNRLLRCYVLIDLKRDKLTHQDLGQMQMYVNYFDRYVKTENEEPTVGIVLCHQKNDALVELTLPEDSNIRASQYQLYLPSKEELKQELQQIEQELESCLKEE